MIVRGRRGDDRQACLVGQLRQRVVPFVGERVEGVGELDHHVGAAESVDQLGQRLTGRVEGERAEAACFQRLPQGALAAAGEH